MDQIPALPLCDRRAPTDWCPGNLATKLWGQALGGHRYTCDPAVSCNLCQSSVVLGVPLAIGTAARVPRWWDECARSTSLTEKHHAQDCLPSYCVDVSLSLSSPAAMGAG